MMPSSSSSGGGGGGAFDVSRMGGGGIRETGRADRRGAFLKVDSGVRIQNLAPHLGGTRPDLSLDGAAGSRQDGPWPGSGQAPVHGSEGTVRTHRA